MSPSSRLRRCPRWSAATLLLAAGLAACDASTEQDLRVAWSIPTGAEYNPSLISAPATDGAHFFAAHSLGVDAFDVRTGARMWRATGLGGAELTSNLVVSAGRLFAAGDRVAALDAQTGAMLWSFNPDSTASVTFSSADAEMVYVGDYGRNVYALDAATGVLRWRVNVATAEWGRFGFNAIRGTTVAGDTLYVTTERKYTQNGRYGAAVLVALDRRTGRELWRHQNGGPTDLYSTRRNAVVSGAFLVYADALGQAYVALRRVDGTVAWRVATSAELIGPRVPPLVEKGVVYGAAGDSYVYAIEIATGAVRWKRRPMSGSFLENALCGRAVLANQLGVTVLDQSSGNELARFYDDSSDLARSGFAVAGTRAFFLTHKRAVAIDCPV